MLLKKENSNLFNKVSISAIILISILYFSIIIYKRPWVDCDLLEGIFSLNNYINGLGFNQSITIDSQNKITSGLLSYWAPGQYVYPYLVSKLLHINIANAMIITNILFLISGFWCYYLLLKHFKFCDKIILASIFILVAQRFFSGLLLKMYAVDMYLMVFSTMSILLFEKYFNSSKNTQRAFYLLLILLVSLGGLFTKNSYLLFIVFSSIGYFSFYMIKYLKQRSATVDKVIRSAFPGAMGLIACLLFYFFYYSQGRIPFDKRYSPVSNEFTLLKIANVIIKPITETLGSSFTFDALLLRIPSPTHSYFAFTSDFTWQGIIGSILIIVPLVHIIYRYFKAGSNKIFSHLTITLILGYTAFFAISIIKQTDVYAEDRLFLPMILFVLPIYLSALLEKHYTKYIIIGYTIVSLIFSTFAIANTWKYYNKSSVIHRNDIISGFMIHSETDDFSELKQIGEILNTKYSKNNILIAKSKEQFLLTQTNLLAIPKAMKSSNDIDSLLTLNSVFFDKKNISMVSIITNSTTPLEKTKSELIEEVKFKKYNLYVFRVRK